MPTVKRLAPRSAKQVMSRAAVQDRFEAIVANIGKVIKGKDEVVRLALTALIADGHVLFEDLPGTGKTMLARSIAQSFDATTSRIQCTPDLLPADITGSTVLDRKTGEFIFRPGPVFANVFLADEINRATPKTQSAMLEAMAERRTSYDGVTHDLPKPFFVLATMNPIELAGTFPLPEAQLDRFLFKLSMGYPGHAAEAEVLAANGKSEAIISLGAVADITELVAMMDWATEVSVSPAITDYIIHLVSATRSETALQMGASTRASLSLLRAARALAAAQGRDDVLPDDVRELIKPVLAHRLVLTPDSLLRDESIDAVIERIMSRVKAPLGLAKSGLSLRRGRHAESSAEQTGEFAAVASQS